MHSCENIKQNLKIQDLCSGFDYEMPPPVEVDPRP